MSWFKSGQQASRVLVRDQEAELLAQLKSGDSRAVEKWFKTYQPKIQKLVSSKVSNRADVDEVVQDTFRSCLKHLPLFRGDASISTWMQRIARHEVADYYRKKYAKKAIRALPLAEFLLAAPPHNAHETSEKVALVLKQLPKQYQELLLLKYVDRKKVKQIAIELDRSVKAIESDLFRARQAFKEAYAQA